MYYLCNINQIINMELTIEQKQLLIKEIEIAERKLLKVNDFISNNRLKFFQTGGQLRMVLLGTYYDIGKIEDGIIFPLTDIPNISILFKDEYFNKNELL